MDGTRRGVLKSTKLCLVRFPLSSLIWGLCRSKVTLLGQEKYLDEVLQFVIARRFYWPEDGLVFRNMPLQPSMLLFLRTLIVPLFACAILNAGFSQDTLTLNTISYYKLIERALSWSNYFWYTGDLTYTSGVAGEYTKRTWQVNSWRLFDVLDPHSYILRASFAL